MDENNTTVGMNDYIMDGVFDDQDILNDINSSAHVVKNWGKFEPIRKYFVRRTMVSLRDKSYFFHMLAVMVSAGVDIVTALNSLAHRSDNERFRDIIKDMVEDVEAGASLSASMSKFEHVFDDADIGIVKSGEATGSLDSLLFRLSGQLDSRYELNMKLVGAAAYPVVVCFVLVIVTIGMLTWVFPKLVSLLQEGGISGESLPFFTRMLLGFQGFIVGFWWLVLALALMAYGAFKYYVGTNYGAIRWDYFKLKIPLFGGLIRKVQVLRFVSLLGLLVESGLPIIKALKISGESLSNKVYRLKIQEIINGVRGGKKISDSMKSSEFIFPSEIARMLAVGESSASLAKVAIKVSDQYQREVDNVLRAVASVFEPVLILVVGIFVALLALAVMAPIFSLGTIAGI